MELFAKKYTKEFLKENNIIYNHIADNITNIYVENVKTGDSIRYNNLKNRKDLGEIVDDAIDHFLSQQRKEKLKKINDKI